MSNFTFRSDFWLSDYIYKIGNFNTQYIQSAFNTEGYYDFYNINTDQLLNNNTVTKRRKSGSKEVGSTTKKDKYEFVLIPNLGFLASPKQLIKNCELKIRFNRAKSSVALLRCKAGTESHQDLEITDCYAQSTYISSDILKSYFDGIDTSPITYEYDDVEIILKSLPTGETNIRFDNVRGGIVPSYIFVGIVSTNALKGSLTESSTRFARYNVDELDIKMNGNSVNGYPISVNNGSAAYPLYQFQNSIERNYNSACGSSLKIEEFEYNWIWAHKFEAEDTQGWISLNVNLDTAYATNEKRTMVIWLITPSTLSIDRFHQIDKNNNSI